MCFRNRVLIISHTTFPGDCRVHIFCDNLSRNSCFRFHATLILRYPPGLHRRLPISVSCANILRTPHDRYQVLAVEMAGSYRSVFILWLSLTTLCFILGKVKRCEKMKIPMCQNIGYNLTYMPNMFNHDTQEEAALEVHQFWPLVEIKCSPDLKNFLCSVYGPKCELHAKENEFPPCRSLCESARNGCAPLMRQYGFSWPERLRCKQFPKLGQNKTCLHSNVTETTQASTTLSTTLALSPTGKISNWRKCEKIKISMCKNTGYNSTYMPNMFKHHTQAEAALELHKFWLLVKVNCSLELKRFLCHIYVPKCEPHINNVLLPCRRLCRRVRTDCASFMNQHNIDWPHQMKCENFPELGDDKTTLSTTLAVSPTGKISNWRKCEKIKISMCENTGYNSTYMPNMFNHHTQAEAALELHKFWLLVKVNCSLELKRFLCHIYVPKCEPHINNVLLPCRRLCRRVRTDCASFMNQHNIDWPHQMNCENFPELGDDKTCLDPEAVGTRHKDGPSSRVVSGLSTATIVGIVIATVAVITVVVVVVAVCHDKKRNPNRYRSVLRSAPASWLRSVQYITTPHCGATRPLVV